MTEENYLKAIEIKEEIKKYTKILRYIDANKNIALNFGVNKSRLIFCDIKDYNVIDDIRTIIYKKIVKLEEQFRYI